MRNRFLIGLAAALALGALLDTTVPHEHVGVRTIGEIVRTADGVSHDHAETFGLIQRARSFRDWYSIHVAVREFAPNATLVVDESIRRADIRSVLFLGIGAAQSVVTGDLSHVAAPDGAPTATGLHWWRGSWQPWTLWSAGGANTTLLIVEDGVTLNVIDRRLLPDSTPLEGSPERTADGAERAVWDPVAATQQQLLPAALAEWATLMLLLVLGGALVPRGPFGPGLRLPLSLISGVALQASLALLLLPGRFAILATTVVAASSAVIAERAGTPVGWRLRDFPGLMVAGAGLGAVILWARTQASITFTQDSFYYWSGGAALARGDLGLGDLDVKRGLSQQALHSAGFTFGAGGVPTLGHVMLVTGLLVLVAAALARSERRLRSPGALVAVLALLAIALSPQVRTHAAYVNGHVLVAALLLALVVLVGAVERRSMQPAITAVIGALVVSRPEGAALVALVILGASLGRRTSLERSAGPLVAPWFLLGVMSFLWGGTLTVAGLLHGGERALATDLLLLIGLGACLAGLLQHTTSRRTWRAIVLSGGAVLWAVTLVLLAQERVNFLDMAIENLGRGRGGWGVFGPALLITALLSVVLTSGSGSAEVQAARWLLIGFVPVALLSKLGDGLQDPEAGLELLLSGGGRVGWGDSVNRMWMHAVLVVGYLLAMSADRADRPRSRTDDAGSLRARIAPQAAQALLLLVLGSWIALQWRPDYVPWDPRTYEQGVLDVTGSEALTELIDGTVVEQRVAVEPPDLIDGAMPVELCVIVPLVTFGRDIVGDVLIEVEHVGRSATRVIEERRIVDFGSYWVCVDLDDGGRALLEEVEARVRVTSVGGVEGSAPGVLRADRSPGLGASISRPVPDGVRIDRGEYLALAASVIVAEPPAALDRPVQRASVSLPWLVLLLGSGAVASRVRGGI